MQVPLQVPEQVPVQVAGAVDRDVYFPRGKWLPLLGGTSEPVVGPQTQKVAAAVTEIPAFALAGTLLPMLPNRVETVLPVSGANPPVTLSQEIGRASCRERV